MNIAKDQRQHGTGGDNAASDDSSNTGGGGVLLRSEDEKQEHTATPTTSLLEHSYASPSKFDATDAAGHQHEEILAGRRTSNFLGRGGDVRMHQAVAARLAAPSLTLMEALVEGGFSFPTSSNKDHSGGFSPPKTKTVDEDGVQLKQRKNQLTRRLRVIRNKKKKEEKTGDLGVNLSAAAGDIHHQQHQQQHMIGNSATSSTTATANVSYLARHVHPSPEENNEKGAKKKACLDQPRSTLTSSNILPSYPTRNVTPSLQQIAKNGPNTRTIIGTRNHDHVKHSSATVTSMAESLLNQDMLLTMLQNTDYRQRPSVFSSAAGALQRKKRSVEEMSGARNLADFFIAVGKNNHQQNQQQQQQLLFRDVIRNDQLLLPANTGDSSSTYASSSMLQPAAPPHAAVVQDANVKDLLESLGIRISDDDSRGGATFSNNLRQQVLSAQQSENIQEPHAIVLHPSRLLSLPSPPGLDSMGDNRLMFLDAAVASSCTERNSPSNRQRAGLPVLDPTNAPNNIGAMNPLVGDILSSCEAQLSLAVDIYTQQRRGLILNSLMAAGFVNNWFTSRNPAEVINALICAFEMKLSSSKKARAFY